MIRRNPNKPGSQSSRRTRLGAATVELAVLAPFLVFMAVIAVDWARLLYFTITLNGCARNGAIYLCDEQFKSASPYSNVSEASLAEAPALTGATVTNSRATVNGVDYISVTVSVPFSTLSNFPGVPSSQTLRRTVKMQVLPMTAK